MADNLTHIAHRTLLPGQARAPEHRRQDPSSFPATGTTNPGDPDRPESSEEYRRLHASGSVDWRLSVEGLVVRPGSFSLADPKRLPSRTHITRHVCEEGWTAIGEWMDVLLSCVLDAVGLRPEARFVNFHSFDSWKDRIDLLDALHPRPCWPTD